MSTSPHESEQRTRLKRVDPWLRSQGWQIVPFSDLQDRSSLTAHAVTEYPTDNGPADYGLFVDGRLLGIVEAKKLSLGPQNVLTQAERYSKGVFESPFNFRGFRVPFLYSTNGEIIWFHAFPCRSAANA
jgi:type I restriction enzyme R subunit